MEDNIIMLKAIADETRLEMLRLLLCRSYCVGALARKLELTEAAISQHLKVLREAGLVTGEKRGYFTHYDVDRDRLLSLGGEIEKLTEIERKPCEPEQEECLGRKGKLCQAREKCKKNVGKEHICKGNDTGEKSGGDGA